MLLNLEINTLSLVAPPRGTISIPSKTSQQQPLLDYPNDPEARFKNLNLHKNANKRVNSNGFVLKKKNVHTKCSTKCVNYNGRVLAILQALDTIHDLDKALGPWEKRLGKKEMSIILKEQVCWERALMIF